MIGAVRGWLTGVVAVSLLVFLVRMLLPESAVRRVAEFTGGLLLLSALLYPLKGLAPKLLETDVSHWQQEIGQRQEELEETQADALSAVIAEKTASYISDKAEALGLSLRVTVETEPTAEGLSVPVAAEVEGPYSQAIASLMETELGIPRERQVWHGREN